MADLRKKATKAEKMLKKLEKKHGESSADFFTKYQAGEFTEDADCKKWADKYTTWLEVAASLEKLEKQAEGFQTANCWNCC